MAGVAGCNAKGHNVRSAEKMIGAAIFERAFNDLKGLAVNRRDYPGAVTAEEAGKAGNWLLGNSDGLRFWCEACEIQPEAVRAVARARLAEMGLVAKRASAVA